MAGMNGCRRSDTSVEPGMTHGYLPGWSFYLSIADKTGHSLVPGY